MNFSNSHLKIPISYYFRTVINLDHFNITVFTVYNRKIRKDATYPRDLWIFILTLALVDKKTISRFRAQTLEQEVLQSTDSGATLFTSILVLSNTISLLEAWH